MVKNLTMLNNSIFFELFLTFFFLYFLKNFIEIDAYY